MIRKMSAILLVLIFMFSFTVTGIGASGNFEPDCTGPKVEPYAVTGNPTELVDYRDDNKPFSSYFEVTFNDTDYKVNYTVVDSVYLKFWEENGNPIIERAVVKGGTIETGTPGANVYDYDPAVYNDCNLTTPRGQEISWIGFVFTPPPPDDPQPQLTIEKELLDEDGTEITDSDVEFTVTVTGGEGDFETGKDVDFSVNNPAVLGPADGLEFDVEYTVEEVEHPDYDFMSIDPDEPFTLSTEDNEVTVTVVNQVPEEDPQPQLTIEKELLDEDGTEITDSDVEFTVTITGGEFGEGEDFNFSVNDPKVLGPDDDLEFDVVYTITENTGGNYDFEGFKVDGGELDTDSSIEITLLEDEYNDITVTVVNSYDPPDNGNGEREQFGSLTVEKEILNSEAGDNELTFEALVEGPADFGSEVVEFSVENPSRLTGLPFGNYTVTEQDTNDEFIIVEGSGEVNLSSTGQFRVVTLVNQRPDDEDEPEIVVTPEPTETPPVVVDEPEVEIITPEEPAVEPEEEIIVEREEPAVEPEEEVIVVAEERELPRTGGFEFLFMGIGGALAGAGAFLKLRGRKK